MAKAQPQAVVLEAKPLSFLDTLIAHAPAVLKLSNAQANADPKLAARTRFSNAAGEQIKMIQSAAPKTRWYTKLPDSSYELTLRNGNTAMKVGEHTFFKAKDAAAAVAFLEAVQVGTKAGELDDALATTTRKPKTKKEAVVATREPVIGADAPKT